MGFGPIGLPQILIILLIVLLIFGAKRLPEIGSSLGKGIRSFKSSVTGEEEPKPTTVNSETPDSEEGKK
ncbi:MAG: twin-arginine translocase TatA/TatE family subunit [Chloroflexota bacterium]|nr:twin-arginine translocase TatA/TatE family subunit [Chloroflexota bacterium]